MTIWNSKKEEEENIFKRRLLFDGHGIGDDRKLLSLMRSITKFCLQDEPADHVDKSALQINQLLQQSITAADKCEKILDVYKKDFMAAAAEAEAEVMAIEATKKELEDAKNKLEMESELQLVGALPSRSVTYARIKALDEKRESFKIKMGKHEEQLKKISGFCDEFRKILAYENVKQEDTEDSMIVE